MQLALGAYLFPVNGCAVTATEAAEFDKFNRPFRRTRRLQVEGKFLADGQSALNALEGLLLVALRQYPVPDLVFYQDGGAATNTALVNAGSLSGLQVVDGPNFPQGNGPEYATCRTFAFAVQAIYPGPLAATAYLEFVETISWSGGSSVNIVQPATKGPAQKQRVWQSTPYVAVQQGQAVGWLAYPPVPPPVWLDALKEAPAPSRTSPQWTGKAFERFPIAWKYLYESVTPLVGNPAKVKG